MQMEVDKNWAELLMVMTEDDNGRIRATEEKELMAMSVEDFFIRLGVFKERMDKRIEEINSKKSQND